MFWQGKKTIKKTISRVKTACELKWKAFVLLRKRFFLWAGKTNMHWGIKHNLYHIFERKQKIYQKTAKTLNLIKPLTRRSNKNSGSHKNFEIKKIKEKALKTSAFIKTLKRKLKTLVFSKALKIKTMKKKSLFLVKVLKMKLLWELQSLRKL